MGAKSELADDSIYAAVAVPGGENWECRTLKPMKRPRNGLTTEGNGIVKIIAE
jgi:hypothetical protein